MGVKIMDHKSRLIVALSFVVIVLIAFVTVGAYNGQKEAIYQQGIQTGAVLQQQNIVRSLQATGYVTMNLGADESGQPVNVILAPVQQQQEEQQ
jgi:hypothetical protein